MNKPTAEPPSLCCSFGRNTDVANKSKLVESFVSLFSSRDGMNSGLIVISQIFIFIFYVWLVHKVGKDVGDSAVVCNYI